MPYNQMLTRRELVPAPSSFPNERRFSDDEELHYDWSPLHSCQADDCRVFRLFLGIQ